jgi:nucleotide-binding universal stress UspA family protein
MRIILAIDGSPQSTLAAKSLAHFGPVEEVVLVHATALPDLDHPMITPELRDSVLQEVEAMPLIPEGSGSVQRIHQIGTPSQVILDTAKSAQADLIVLGARGLSPVKELVLGSVSHRVLLHASCSTLIIKTPLENLHHILVPIEGVEDAERIMTFFDKLQIPYPIHLTFMTVWPQPRLPWPVTLGQSQLLEERALEHAQEMVEHIASQFKKGNRQTSSVIGLGDPAFAILEQAQTLQPNLLMVGSHGRKGMTRFLLGSVSHKLVHQAQCPVLVVR